MGADDGSRHVGAELLGSAFRLLGQKVGAGGSRRNRGGESGSRKQQRNATGTEFIQQDVGPKTPPQLHLVPRVALD